MMNASEAPVIKLEQIDVGFASELSALWSQTSTTAIATKTRWKASKPSADANFYVGTAKRMLEDPTPICKVARENANNVGCYLLINTDYPASLGGEASQPKQIYLRSSTYGTGLGHGPLLEATETIGDAANYKKCFKRPIAIEPFIEYFQKLIDQTPPAVA